MYLDEFCDKLNLCLTFDDVKEMFDIIIYHDTIYFIVDFRFKVEDVFILRDYHRFIVLTLTERFNLHYTYQFIEKVDNEILQYFNINEQYDTYYNAFYEQLLCVKDNKIVKRIDVRLETLLKNFTSEKVLKIFKLLNI